MAPWQTVAEQRYGWLRFVLTGDRCLGDHCDGDVGVATVRSGYVCAAMEDSIPVRDGAADEQAELR